MNSVFRPFRKPLRVLCWLIVLVALAGAALHLKRNRSQAAKQEVLRERLTLREGTLCQDGAPRVPFAGSMVERYEDGGIKSRSAVSSGVLEGLSEGWYTNGQKQVEERFHAGVSHGLRTKWYEGGQKFSEANIVAGKIEGVFRRWHDNGVLAEEIAMKAGQPDGLSRAYFPSGSLKAEATLRNGKVMEQHFWKDGEQSGARASRTNAPVDLEPAGRVDAHPVKDS